MQKRKKEFYNSEIVRLGEKGRNTTSIQEYAEVLEDLVEMLEPTAAKFLKHSEVLRSIRPAPRFKEFHFLFVDAISEMHGAAQSFLTLYSMSLNGISVDPSSISRAEALIKSANEKSLRVGYMYNELCPECV